jgi:putative ABC transport system ATP-binding protein
MELVTGLNRDQGITVIMVTHEADIAAYARRAVRFLDGKIEADIPRREAA